MTENTLSMVDGEEVKNTSELAKVKSVYEMMPKMSETNLRRGGRPALNEEHFSILENCLRLDFTITEACDAAGISLSAYYKYYNSNEDFALRMDRARAFPKQMARTAVMKRIWQGDAKTALRYLELRDKRYKGEEVHEEGEENTAPVVQFISVASNEGAENGTNPDTQSDTKQGYVGPGYVSSGEENSEKQTPWENEEEILRRLA